MTSRRRLRRRACTGKRRHATRDEARAEVRRIVRRGASGYVNAYPCAFCGGFHVGRRPGTRLAAPEALK